MRAPDAVFSDPRLAALYDGLDGERDDLDAYVALAEEVGAHWVVDVGCGTGSLAVRLAAQGLLVVGVDPAAASLAVARTKSTTGGLAGRIEWVHGDATALVGRVTSADLVVMTGNVVQVFVSDEDWQATLSAVRGSLRDGGWLVLETRRPEARDWEQWDVGPTTRVLADGTRVGVTRRVTRVVLPLVTFEDERTVDGETLSSVSTLRFRTRPEVEHDLLEQGFEVIDVREAPDRPGKELVFVGAGGPARRAPAVILSEVRDPRLVTVRRGGTLTDDDHRLLALWAATCAEHILGLFEAVRPDDPRPRAAIEHARAWVRGEVPMMVTRSAGGNAMGAARDLRGAARSAAYSAGQAGVVAHVAAHELGAAAYAIKAVREAAPAPGSEAAGRAECRWQRDQLPAEIRALVLDDQRLRNELCWSTFEE